MLPSVAAATAGGATAAPLSLRLAAGCDVAMGVTMGCLLFVHPLTAPGGGVSVTMGYVIRHPLTAPGGGVSVTIGCLLFGMR